MVVRKRKKNTRQRAHTTHGWGSMKKRRGAGNRGGRGNAGVGKRSAHKKPSYFKNKRYLGGKGFTRHAQTGKTNPLNLSTLQQKLDTWVTQGKATKQGDTYTIDANQLGFTKLLGSGKLTKKVNLTIAVASVKAQEGVKAAGGSLITTGSNDARGATDGAKAESADSQQEE